MTQTEVLRDKYYGLLLSCVDMLVADRECKMRKDECDRLRARANAQLAATDSIVKDVDDLIDWKKGEIKPAARFVLDTDRALAQIVVALFDAERELRAAQTAYKSWDDEFVRSVDLVLAIGACKDARAEIIDELGIEQGEAVVHDCLVRIVEVEKGHGLYFFTEELILLENLWRIRTLRPTATELGLTLRDNGSFENLLITNDRGEQLSFEKFAQIQYGNAIYLELAVKEDMKVPHKLCHYLVDQDARGVVLRLVEDEALSDALYKLVEKKYF